MRDGRVATRTDTLPKHDLTSPEPSVASTNCSRMSRQSVLSLARHVRQPHICTTRGAAARQSQPHSAQTAVVKRSIGSVGCLRQTTSWARAEGLTCGWVAPRPRPWASGQAWRVQCATVATHQFTARATERPTTRTAHRQMHRATGYQQS